MRNITFLFLLFSYTCFSQTSSCPKTTVFLDPVERVTVCNDTPWEMVFSDEFNGNSLDASKWMTQIGPDSPFDKLRFQDGVHEGAVYLDQNVSVDGGLLTIEAKREDYTHSGNYALGFNDAPELIGSVGDPFSFDLSYTSGTVTGLGDFNASNNLKFVAKIRMTNGDGLWPAFWSFSGPNEFDFFEVFNSGEDDHFASTIWRGGNNKCESINDRPSPQEGWHIWEAVIKDFVVYVKVDGQLVNTFFKYYPYAACPGEMFAEVERLDYFPDVNQQFAPIINLAVKRENADNFEVENGTLEVDYIRVYRQNGPCGTVEHLNIGSNDNVIVDLNSNYNGITVEDGGVLTLKNSIIKLCPDATIKLMPGSTLIIDGSIVTRFSGDQDKWRGISIPQRGNNAILQVINGSKIEKSVYGISNSPVLGNLAYDQNGDFEANGGDLSLLISNSTMDENDLGVTIVGNDGRIDIRIENGSVISNSVSGMRVLAFDNGTVNIDDSDFISNDKGIDFFQGNSINRLVNGCDFINNKVGVKLRDDNGTVFTGNLIEGDGLGGVGVNQTKGFVSIESSFDFVNGNTIKEHEWGMLIEGTHPLGSFARVGSMETEKNYFSNNHWMIKADGNANPMGVLIENNLMDQGISGTSVGNFFGFVFSGEHEISAKNNTVNVAYSSMYSVQSGSSFNEFACNEFINSRHSDFRVVGTHRNSLFFGNEFNSPISLENLHFKYSDIRDQGNDINPADNCFELDGVMDIKTSMIPHSFDYYHNSSIDCVKPTNSGGVSPFSNLNVYSTVFVDKRCPETGVNNLTGGTSTPIFTSLPPPIIIADPEHCWQFSEICIKDSIDFWILDVLDECGDNPYTLTEERCGDDEPDDEDFKSQRRLSNWLRYAISYAQVNHEYEIIEEILLPLKKWKWQKQLFGVYIVSRQYDKASNLLASLNQETSLDVASFVETQEINLTRLNSSKYYYQLSEIEKSTLERIATNNTESSGYATSLYHLLTGIVLNNIEEHFDEDLVDRSTVFDKGNVKLFPNPASDEITVILPLRSEINSISVLDLNGFEKLEKTFDNTSSNIKLNVSSLNAGMYILMVKYRDGSHESIKFATLGK